MLSKLPKWVWVGAWMLALVAGIVNVIGFMGFQHQAITHLTGTTTNLGGAIARADGAMILHQLVVIASFVVGAALSGALIQDSTLQLGRRYSGALALESLMLCAAAYLLKQHSALGLYLASTACGLQNGMVSTYSGSAIRTTHVSGMLTDLGIYFGHALRRIPVDTLRLRLCGIIITGFLCGAVIGGIAFQQIEYNAMFIAAALAGAIAIAYHTYGRKHPVADATDIHLAEGEIDTVAA